MFKHTWNMFAGLLLGTSVMAYEIPDMPVPVSNNAVTAVSGEDGLALYSFTGLLSGKSWQHVTNRSWWLPAGADQWQELPPVPGDMGRLAAVAVTAGQTVWVFGGYTVAEDHSEVSTPETFRVDPGSRPVYQRMADMPVPVDDAAALVYQDRYIYLISGWHDVGNVNLVQIYDTETNRWQQGTPWPGEPVFGHAGAIDDRNLLVCGGVKIEYQQAGGRDFVLTDDCWQGIISSSDIRRIGWRRAESMPVTGRYRAAAAALADGSVMFVGGSDNPYNYDGIGYNEAASEPLKSVISFDFSDGQWRCHPPVDTPSMDHRGLLVLSDGSTLRLGGMLAGQQVTNKVLRQAISEPGGCNP